MIPNKYKNEGPEWAWLDQIQAGDILLEKGKERVVRQVSRFKAGDRYGRDGKVSAVWFAILRCSWTGRCHTVVMRTDLKTRKFTPTGLRKETCNMVDKLIAHDLLYTDKKKQRLTCCTVKGVR